MDYDCWVPFSLLRYLTSYSQGIQGHSHATPTSLYDSIGIIETQKLIKECLLSLGMYLPMYGDIKNGILQMPLGIHMLSLSHRASRSQARLDRPHFFQGSRPPKRRRRAPCCMMYDSLHMLYGT